MRSRSHPHDSNELVAPGCATLNRITLHSQTNSITLWIHARVCPCFSLPMCCPNAPHICMSRVAHIPLSLHVLDSIYDSYIGILCMLQCYK
jgi:hypothetical protein